MPKDNQQFGDIRGHLQTGARIIAEDDAHLVVAVRIKKEWLRSNACFLDALADATRKRDADESEQRQNRLSKR
jgi:hypothetical protein